MDIGTDNPLKLGMTPENVINQLGPPETMTEHEEKPSWQWHRSEEDREVRVWVVFFLGVLNSIFIEGTERRQESSEHTRAFSERSHPSVRPQRGRAAREKNSQRGEAKPSRCE